MQLYTGFSLEGTPAREACDCLRHGLLTALQRAAECDIGAEKQKLEEMVPVSCVLQLVMR